MAIPAALFFIAPTRLGSSFNSWHLVLVWAALVVLACTLITNPAPGRITRALILCGDASYSTYLFHSFVFLLIIRVHRDRFNPSFSGAALLWVTLIPWLIAANLVGILIHITIERPLTRALRGITERTAHPELTASSK